jgi:hypothetical protein
VRIVLDTTGATPSTQLLDVDDFKSFDLKVLGDRAPALESGIDWLGARADQDHVFVNPARLRELAGERASDPAWLASLAGMLEFAAEHGWIDERGWVSAHIAA